MSESRSPFLITAEEKQRLSEFYWQRKAIEEGDFLLASGKRSHYYVDSRLVTTHPPALKLIAEIMSRGIASATAGASFKLLAPVLSGVPVALAVGLVMGADLVFDRGTNKQHGKGKRFEGHLEKGNLLVLVDDLITAGTTLRATVQAVREEGARTDSAFVIVDRLEGGRDRLEPLGTRLFSLLTIQELFEYKQ